MITNTEKSFTENMLCMSSYYVTNTDMTGDL